LSASAFEAYKNDVGLSNASSANPVATKDDIAGIAGAMHFIGAATLSAADENPISCLNRTFTGDKAPKAGDVAIIIDTAKEFVYVSGDGITAKWLELGDESLHATKTDLKTAETNLSNGLSTYAEQQADKVRTDLTAVSSDINGRLTAEINARTTSDTKFTADIKTLSGAIDSKISVGDYADNAYAWRENSNLSVVKIGADDYHQLVANGGPIDENTIYIVSSDNINAYGERITQVATPKDETDAANKKYVDDTVATATTTLKSTALSGVSINGVDATVGKNVATIQIDLIDCGNASTADLTV